MINQDDFHQLHNNHYELLVHEKEIELVKHINEFRDEVIESAKQRAPHKIANYIAAKIFAY